MLKPLDSEDHLYPIATAFEAITGSRPSPPTIWRWKIKGSKGVRLPFVQVGGQAKISLTSARQWLEDVTQASCRASLELSKTSPARAQKAAQQLSDLIRQ